MLLWALGVLINCLSVNLFIGPVVTVGYWEEGAVTSSYMLLSTCLLTTLYNLRRPSKTFYLETRSFHAPHKSWARITGLMKWYRLDTSGTYIVTLFSRSEWSCENCEHLSDNLSVMCSPEEGMYSIARYMRQCGRSVDFGFTRVSTCDFVVPGKGLCSIPCCVE